MKLLRNKRQWSRVQLVLGVIVTFAGVAMLTAGFCVPPTGEIHSSVLVAYGETLTFAGTLLGIDAKYKSKIDDKIQKHEDENHNNPPTF